MKIDWQDLEAVKRVKYKYMRCVDTKNWSELETCFTVNATASYSGGKYSADGRSAILEFLTRTLDSKDILTSHCVHHPEIDFQSETEATGIWAIEDTVIHETFGVTIRGSAFYEDRYVKESDGAWRIAHTGYKRTYEEMFARASIEGLRLTAHRWKTDGQSEINP
jgi:hypothetical protein